MPLTIAPDSVGFNARGNGTFNKPFPEQQAFFRQKLNIPTEKYDDILKSAHDRGFMVAGAAKADLLVDFRVAIDKAISEGKSLGWFQKEFDNIVAKHGWDYKGGRDWRSRIIYTTNLRASYAAGRYAQLTSPSLLQSRPYWKYVHNDTVLHPRPLHVSWSGLVLKHDDPFWQTHFPPNGWGCRCQIEAAKASEYQGAQAPDDGVYTKVDPYGEAHVMPKGIDYGWDYAPGANADTSLRDLVQQKLIRYPEAISSALSRDVNRYLNASEKAKTFTTRALALNTAEETLWLGFVENATDIKAATGIDSAGYLLLLKSSVVRHVQKSHGNDGGEQRPPTAEDYELIPGMIANPTSIELSKDKSYQGNAMIVVWATSPVVATERFRIVFEVLKGKKNRALSLFTMLIKTR